MRVVACTIRPVAAAFALLSAAVATPDRAAADTPVACSEAALVSAVNLANSTGGGALALASGCTYTLTSAAGSGAGPSGLPAIITPIRMTGAAGTVITRDPTAPQFRIAEVDGAAQRPGADGQLTLNSITVDGGDAGFGVGGGIANLQGTVTLNGVRVTGNHAAFGGGLYNEGQLTLFVGLVTGNAADLEGGGVYNQAGQVFRRGTGIAGNSPDNCAPVGSVTGGCPG
jgi:hypothetical protein